MKNIELTCKIGGILTVMHNKPDEVRMGFLQGCSAGVMIFISFADLLEESVKVVGFETAYLFVRKAI